jgi:hypothetical protein
MREQIIEKSLIDLVNRILKKDSKEYLWHHDESRHRHFKMGPEEGPFMEGSWEKIGDNWVGRIIIRQNVHSQFAWTLKEGSELMGIVHYLEEDAAELTKDQDYLDCVANEEVRKQMIANMKLMVDSFFKTIDSLWTN